MTLEFGPQTCSKSCYECGNKSALLNLLATLLCFELVARAKDDSRVHLADSTVFSHLDIRALLFADDETCAEAFAGFEE